MLWTEQLFKKKKPIIAMLHLDPLPGDPRYDSTDSMEKVVEHAIEDLISLQNGGVADMDLSQYLGHILVETVTSFLLLPTLQTRVGLDSESSYGFDFGYKTLQCS